MKYLPFLLTLVFFACNSGNEEQVVEEISTDQAADDRSMMQRMDLSEHGFPFSIWVPGKELSNMDPVSTFDDSFMHVQVASGKRFQMLIRQEQGAMDQLKSALDNDILREHEYLTEEPHLLIYRSSYPDQETSFIHFYFVFEVNGEPYVAEDVKEVDLNEADIQKMLDSLQDLELPV